MRINKTESEPPMKPEPNNRDCILEAARELITRKGIASTALSDIAKQTGLAKGTVHYYFPSKHEILLALADKQVREYSDRFLKLAEEHSSPARRREVLLGIIREMASPTQGALLIHLIMEGNAGNEKLRKRFLKRYGEWCETLQRGLTRLFAGIAPDSAPMVLASLNGYLFHHVVGAPAIDAEHALGFLLRGIGAETPEP
ncbi:MAG: TetR family transcriptional regulator [Chitinivibrionales bacterium]|nr:TetR family transcriptional regulator [Chitinivibrionales bacterium]